MARCIAVIGGPGSGKTTLVDRLAGLEGGTVAERPSATAPRITGFGFLGETWSAIDCPGSIEFLQDSVDALLVADAAVICVPPDPETAVLSAPYIRAVEAAGTPSVLFVNRIDEAQGRVRDIVAGLQGYASHVVTLRQVPIREGGATVGAVDLVSERAWRYREGEPSALIELPAEIAEREQEARADLLENLSEFDDWLLEEIVEDRTPAEGPVYSICARALTENRAIPALIGSAAHGNGILRLMKLLRHEAPQVDALRDRLAASAGVDAPLLAAGFRAEVRRHVGRTIYLRSFADGLKSGDRLGGEALGMLKEPGHEGGKIAHPLEAGALAAAVKSDHLASGALYSADAQHPAPGWSRTGPGQITRLILPKNERDDVKLSEALARVAADDRAMQVGQHVESGAMQVAVPGPMHFRALRDRLAEVFGLDTEEAPVPPTYREAITRPVDVHYRHKKQTGGAGQFADVKLTVAPADRDSGFAFAETVKGGAVPRNYIPAVEQGARDAMAKGPLGFPVVDVSVTLTDGQAHSVDSSDMAFRIAGRQGVAQGLADAAPVLLQPIHLVRFHVPSVFTGALVPIVSSLHGQVLGYDRDETANGWDVFRAYLPESALAELAGQLRSATQGVGWFASEVDHYQEIYGKEADRVLEAARA
jgi:elongation factor G